MVALLRTPLKASVEIAFFLGSILPWFIGAVLLGTVLGNGAGFLIATLALFLANLVLRSYVRQKRVRAAKTGVEPSGIAAWPDPRENPDQALRTPITEGSGVRPRVKQDQPASPATPTSMPGAWRELLAAWAIVFLLGFASDQLHLKILLALAFLTGGALGAHAGYLVARNRNGEIHWQMRRYASRSVFRPTYASVLMIGWFAVAMGVLCCAFGVVVLARL